MEAALITSDYERGNIRMRRETLGGSVYDIGVYSNSLILRMLGREPEKIKAVSTFSDEGFDMYAAVLMEYENGVRANFSCGMVLATEKGSSIDRFQIHGEKGSIESVKFGFNAPGELSYIVRTFEGMKEKRTVQVPQNYRLEVEQFDRCITEGEVSGVSEEFSVASVHCEAYHGFQTWYNIGRYYTIVIRWENVMVIEFSDNLITGNTTIDTQHKELIGSTAAFVNACVSSKQTSSSILFSRMWIKKSDYEKYW